MTHEGPVRGQPNVLGGSDWFSAMLGRWPSGAEGARQLNPRYSASRESLHGGHSTGEGAMSDLVFSAVTATAVIAWMAWITLALFGA